MLAVTVALAVGLDVSDEAADTDGLALADAVAAALAEAAALGEDEAVVDDDPVSVPLVLLLAVAAALGLAN